VVVEGGAHETYDYVYGLFNANGAEAILRGGHYSAVGGERTRGIISEHPNTTLDAHGVVVEGRDGTVENFGLFTNGPSTAGVRSSALTGGTALRTNGSTVHLALSQVDGGVSRTGGTLTCFGVYGGDYLIYTCP
jgi:hypothetical protein